MSDATDVVDCAINSIQQIIDAGFIDEEAVVRDLLANLMHWCREYGIDFDYELKIASQHFEQEVNDLHKEVDKTECPYCGAKDVANCGSDNTFKRRKCAMCNRIWLEP